MPLEATQKGAQEKTKAFPSPETLDKDIENSENRDIPINPRDAIMDNMEARIDQQRQEEMLEAGYVVSEEDNSYAAEPEQGAPEDIRNRVAVEEQNEELPAELQNDPLADYIVMENDVAMFRTKVDGEDRLIPLETAKATLQKHTAADVRLQQVAQQRKDVDAREEAVRVNELAYQARIASQEASPPSVQSDVSDQDLQTEARDVVEVLFKGTEDEAVASLTNLLGKTRQAPGPQVDPSVVGKAAVAAAKQQLQEERAAEDAATNERKLNDGFKSFEKNYKDIVGDVNLFRYADGLTDVISTENPDWSPTEVMAEAGNQTRLWVESLKAPEPEPDTANDRHGRKRKLTPMPTVRSGVQEREEGESVETPASMMDDIRAARGQG